jgi:peptidoglycan/LPS O-acetylase OafA/YrhL
VCRFTTSSAGCPLNRLVRSVRSVRFHGIFLTPSLVTQIHGRDNNIGLLRLLAAVAVLVFHCYALFKLWQFDPVARYVPDLDLGALGVGTFFYLSGLLVTESYTHRNSLREFLLARALRIYPALVVAAAVALTFAAASSVLPLSAFLQSADVWDFFLRTSAGLTVLGRLPSVYSNNPIPYSLNGSLWTLPIELRMYWAVAAFGALGLFTRRCGYVAAIGALTMLFVLKPETFPVAHDAISVRRLVLLFALGSLTSIWKDLVLLSIPAAIASIAAIALTPIREWMLPYCICVGYLVVVLAYHPAIRIPDIFRDHDFSYGLYIYAFPIQQTFVERGGADLFGRPVLLFLLSFPITLALAITSWHYIEKPALALKVRLVGTAIKKL